MYCKIFFMVKFSKRIFLQFILNVSIFFVLSFSFFVFRANIRSIVSSISEKYLIENSQLYSGIIEIFFQENFSVLNNICNNFSKIDDNNDGIIDKNERNKIINKLNEISCFSKFSTVVLIDKEGFSIGNQGESFADLTFRDYFKDTVKLKKPQVSNEVFLDSKGIPSVVLTCPVFVDDNVPRILAGTINVNEIDSLFGEKGLNTQVCFYLIKKSGDIVFGSSSKNRLCYEKNFFYFINLTAQIDKRQIVKLYNDIREDKSGIIYYGNKDKKSICAYTPFKLNDCYILSVVPQDFFKARQRDLARNTFFLILIISVIVIMFVISLYLSLKQNEAVTRDNEIINYAFSKNKSMIFEFDYGKKLITLTGDYSFVTGSNKNIYKFDFIDFLAQKVHSDDIVSISLFRKSVLSIHEDYSAELRLRCMDNQYNWFKITTLTIYNEEHKVIKCITTFENVNQQIQREQELRYKAEYDSLSGLLNKGAFETKVSKLLNDEDHKICALFIIDLDNFKTINDTLGHAMGDAAIRDTAKKISLIFSIKDFLGRIGGDEFCVFTVFDNTLSEADCYKLIREKAQSLCEIINEMYFNEEKYVEISASIGIALYPYHGKSFDELFHHADNALYNVKHTVKNNYKVYEDGMYDGKESSYENTDNLNQLI